MQFPEEKVLYEVATIRYVAAQTTIPVPHIYHHGTAAENPTGLGPFIIMDYIDHHQNMSRALLDPNRPIDARPVLDPNITEEKLELLYGQMANILLQLSKLKFPRIGSLLESGDKTSASIGGRPLTANMNNIAIHTSAPASILPNQTYAFADEWFKAMADMHMAQLVFQHNDAVENKIDAREKYVVRQLFRRLAAEKRLVPGSQEDFILSSEDPRPTNVLLDEDLCVVGVIDWEFAYAAPAQFSFDPPWWLLLADLERWDDGYRDWMKTYESRLKTFLRVLEKEERKQSEQKPKDLAESLQAVSLTDGQRPLSRLMRDSWESQTWMINYVARKSWSLDFIWWKHLDEHFFGVNEDEDYQIRLDLLSEAQRKEMDKVVAQKMEEKSRPEVIQWGEEDAARRLAEVLL